MLERREADVGLGGGREGGGLEAALDSSPVSLLHVHTPSNTGQLGAPAGPGPW